MFRLHSIDPTLSANMSNMVFESNFFRRDHLLNISHELRECWPDSFIRLLDGRVWPHNERVLRQCDKVNYWIKIWPHLDFNSFPLNFIRFGLKKDTNFSSLYTFRFFDQSKKKWSISDWRIADENDCSAISCFAFKLKQDLSSQH